MCICYLSFSLSAITAPYEVAVMNFSNIVYYRHRAFFNASSNVSIVAGLMIMAFAPSFITFLRVSGWSSDQDCG